MPINIIPLDYCDHRIVYPKAMDDRKILKSRKCKFGRNKGSKSEVANAQGEVDFILPKQMVLERNSFKILAG